MPSPFAVRSKPPMLIEDLFDGWLAMPAMPGFLIDDDLSSEYCTTELDKGGKTSEDTLSKVTQFQAPDETIQSRLEIPADSVSSAGQGIRHRRGHTKSRLGCITCKQRKIKCNEVWPSCSNCTKRGSVCRYPAIPGVVRRDQTASMPRSPRPFVQLSTTPGTFSMDDMRLFHHYMVSAYPCIPHDYESIWLREIPLFGHQNDYLMEAILALAGSHLALQVDQPQVELALLHRQKAIAGLERAFSKWPPSAEDAHIMLATTFLLSFQSSYLADGFFETIVSLRGAALLSQFVWQQELRGPFAVEASMHSNSMDLAFQSFPHLDQDIAREGLQSLADFAHLVALPSTQAIEKTMVTQLVETIRWLLEPEETSTHLEASTVTTESPTPAITEASTAPTPSSMASSSPTTTPYGKFKYHLTNPLIPSKFTLDFDDIPWTTITKTSSPRSPIRSFNALMASLLLLSTWPHEALTHILSPSNPLGNVIMAHFFAVRFIISPLSAPENAMRTPVKAMIDWTDRTIAAIKDDDDVKWTQYVKWPTKVLQSLQASAEKNKGLNFGNVRDTVMFDPDALKEGRAGRKIERVSGTRVMW